MGIPESMSLGLQRKTDICPSLGYRLVFKESLDLSDGIYLYGSFRHC